MSGSPTVSVLLPTYNAADYIQETIQSVLAQRDCPSFELIIADDGSTDGTREILRSQTDDRIELLFRDENLGVGANTNQAASIADGDILAFIDHDDVWKAEKLARHVNKHDDTGSGLVYSSLSYIDPEGRYIGEKRAPAPRRQGKPLVQQLFEHGNLIPTLSCVTVRKDIWDEVGGFDDSLSISCDFDFYVRVAREHDFASIDASLAKRRIHSENIAHQYRRIYDDKRRIFDRYRSYLDDDLADRYLGETTRSRASWEFQNGETKQAFAYLKQSLRHDVTLKAALLGLLLCANVFSGPLDLGRRAHERYLDRVAKRRR